MDGTESTSGRHEGESTSLPQKRLYRARAHSNPLNDSFFERPRSPAEASSEWDAIYAAARCEARETGRPVPEVVFADVGCGFGGLTVALAEHYPDDLVLGMELRDKVCSYVQARVEALRELHPGLYRNAGCVRSNAMRDLPCRFRRGQLSKLFFLFADPHFKASNHRRRIIQPGLLAEYAYCLAVGGRLYTISDVEELQEWNSAHLDAHPLFRRLSEDELADDKAAELIATATEESQKVTRNGGKMWRAVHERVRGPDEDWH